MRVPEWAANNFSARARSRSAGVIVHSVESIGPPADPLLDLVNVRGFWSIAAPNRGLSGIFVIQVSCLGLSLACGFIKSVFGLWVMGYGSRVVNYGLGIEVPLVFERLPAPESYVIDSFQPHGERVLDLCTKEHVASVFLDLQTCCKTKCATVPGSIGPTSSSLLTSSAWSRPSRSHARSAASFRDNSSMSTLGRAGPDFLLGWGNWVSVTGAALVGVGAGAALVESVSC